MNSLIKQDSIIATPRGFVMRVVKVIDDDVTCEFLTNPDQRIFSLSEIRFLTNKERPPLILENINYQDLMIKRNVAVATSTIKKRKALAAKRPKSIQERIANAKDNNEVVAILREAGIKTGDN